MRPALDAGTGVGGRRAVQAEIGGPRLRVWRCRRRSMAAAGAPAAAAPPPHSVTALGSPRGGPRVVQSLRAALRSGEPLDLLAIVSALLEVTNPRGQALHGEILATAGPRLAAELLRHHGPVG